MRATHAEIWFFQGAFFPESVPRFGRLNINRSLRGEIAFSCPLRSRREFYLSADIFGIWWATCLRLRENGRARETLGTSPSVPATLDDLLRERADSESGVRSCHGGDRPAESLTRGDHISFPPPNPLRGRNSRSPLFYKNFMGRNIRPWSRASVLLSPKSKIGLTIIYEIRGCGLIHRGRIYLPTRFLRISNTCHTVFPFFLILNFLRRVEMKDHAVDGISNLYISVHFIVFFVKKFLVVFLSEKKITEITLNCYAVCEKLWMSDYIDIWMLRDSYQWIKL